MRKLAFLFCLPAFATPIWSGILHAQSANPAVAPVRTASGYGGGFIELLLTRQDPTPVQQPGYYSARQRAAGAPVDLSVDTPTSQHSLNRPGAPEPGRPGLSNPSASYQQASYAPVDMREVPAMYRKQIVDYGGGEKPGTIVIDTPNKFLFLVQPNGQAMRYGIGVGRPGFEWSGVKSVTRKAEWPGWTPPPEMLKRRPDLPLHMDGGPENPLGARAMYLGSSMYRIHGTNEPGTIGQNVSSGCIRLTNEDVMDLYDRVHVGAKVIVQ